MAVAQGRAGRTPSEGPPSAHGGNGANGDHDVTRADLEELLAALAAARDGDFAIRLPARGAGLGADLRRAFNEVADRREAVAKEIARVGRAIGREGRLTERASSIGLSGYWAETIDAFNTVVEDLARPTTEVARVIDAVAEGDLSQKMNLKIEGRPVKGETMRQDLVSTVSHELRTPLAAIYGAALTLRRVDVDLEDEMRDTLLRVIAEEAARLSEIINDLLLASQLDSGKLHVQLEPCDPLEIVRSEMEAASAHAPATVELSLDAPERIPVVSADPGQLRQVVANLIDNAIKYSPAGGPVTVSVKPDGGSVRLTVSDTGIGIPVSERRRIFEKFYRLDPEMTGGIGGTGLGLYICRELVRRIDGRIWVEENNGQGSTFVVEIPATNSP